MPFLGKFIILKNTISACDYDCVLDLIKKHITVKNNLLVSPLASQTLARSYFNDDSRKILDKYDGLYPDSQWVKWSISLLYGKRLKDRVYGPELMLKICEVAEKEKYRIFLYGNTGKTLKLLKRNLQHRYPGIRIAGAAPSKFKELSKEEKKELISVIEKSRTDILMIGLGSPLEQIFAYELLYKKPKLTKPIIIIPFGAAFDFIARVKPQAPGWTQNAGLEWLFRLICEPRRLWKRYLLLGPLFIILVLWQKLSILLNLSHDKIIKSKTGS